MAKGTENLALKERAERAEAAIDTLRRKAAMVDWEHPEVSHALDDFVDALRDAFNLSSLEVRDET